MLADVVKTLDDIGWPVIDVSCPTLPTERRSVRKNNDRAAIAHADTRRADGTKADHMRT